MNKTIQKSLIVVLGTFLMAAGITGLIISQQGVDTISTFLLGILNWITMEFWQIVLIFNLVMVAVLFIMDKKLLGLGTILNVIVLPLAIWFLSPLISVLQPTFSSGILAFLIVVGSIITFAVGCSVYISAGLGSAALEGLTFAIQQRTNLSIRVIRMSLDISLVVIGFLLGANVGYATVLAMFAVGPIINFTLNILINLKK